MILLKYFLIDFENIVINNVQDLPGIQTGDTVVIFFSEVCKTISLDFLASVTKCSVQLFCYKVTTGTKNALDFQLASQLGHLIREDNLATFFIVSKDKGYDCLNTYWKEQHVAVKRITLDTTLPSDSSNDTDDQLLAIVDSSLPSLQSTVKKKKKKSKASAQSSNNSKKKQKSCTLAEVREVLSDNDLPEKVQAIINQYKTKQEINSDIMKLFKDGQKTSSVCKKIKSLLKEKGKK